MDYEIESDESVVILHSIIYFTAWNHHMNTSIAALTSPIPSVHRRSVGGSKKDGMDGLSRKLSTIGIWKFELSPDDNSTANQSSRMV